jgi:hypothetical protein
MKYKKQKGYWDKKKESFNNGSNAKSRAGHLRNYKHVSHVKVEKVGEQYIVHYSVAKWFIDQLNSSGGKL